MSNKSLDRQVGNVTVIVNPPLNSHQLSVLSNIGGTTNITTPQWAELATIDQNISTVSDVTFNSCSAGTVSAGTIIVKDGGAFYDTIKCSALTGNHTTLLPDADIDLKYTPNQYVNKTSDVNFNSLALVGNITAANYPPVNTTKWISIPVHVTSLTSVLPATNAVLVAPIGAYTFSRTTQRSEHGWMIMPNNYINGTNLYIKYTYVSIIASADAVLPDGFKFTLDYCWNNSGSLLSVPSTQILQIGYIGPGAGDMYKIKTMVFGPISGAGLTVGSLLILKASRLTADVKADYPALPAIFGVYTNDIYITSVDMFYQGNSFGIDTPP